MNGYYYYSILTFIFTLLIEPFTNRLFVRYFKNRIPFIIKYIGIFFIFIFIELSEKYKNYFFVILYIVLAILLYIVIMPKINEFRSYEENEIKYKKIKQKLSNQGFYAYIENFIDKYMSLDFASRNEVVYNNIDNNQVNKLNNLLFEKGCKINIKERLFMINQELI